MVESDAMASIFILDKSNSFRVAFKFYCWSQYTGIFSGSHVNLKLLLVSEVSARPQNAHLPQMASHAEESRNYILFIFQKYFFV